MTNILADTITMKSADETVTMLTGTKTGGIVTSKNNLVVSLTAGETLTAGNLCYFKAADSKMWKADADAEATADTLLGIATANGTADNAVEFLLWGEYVTTGLTVGPYYVSVTAGAVSATAPVGDADIVRKIGYAVATTRLMFMPDWTITELSVA